MPTVPQLRIVFEQVGSVLHHAGRHTSALQEMHDVFRRVLHSPGVQQHIQRRNVLQPACHRMKTRLRGPGWMSHDAAQRYPLVLSTDGDDTPAIVTLAAIHSMWRRAGGAATRPGGDAAIDHVVHEHGVEAMV